MATAFGAEASCSFDDLNYGYPPTVNDEVQTVHAHKAAEKVVGGSHCVTRGAATMGGEVRAAATAAITAPAATAYAARAAALLLLCVLLVLTRCKQDFSFYLEKVPGCFMFAGCTAPDEIMRPHHSPIFDIDERVLQIGTSIWLSLVQTLLIDDDDEQPAAEEGGGEASAKGEAQAEDEL